MQSLAMLDAILSPEWEYRYYSFNAKWNTDEAIASMRDGSGDEMWMLFTSAGAIIKGFAHESPVSPYIKNPPSVWPGILDSVPAIFSDFLNEPAFSLSDTTFCIWRTKNDRTWQHGDIEFPEGSNDPDGSVGLLAMMDGNPQTYQAWAEYYFERPIDLSSVIHIYKHHPLTDELIKKLNTDTSMQEIISDVDEIGYRQWKAR